MYKHNLIYLCVKPQNKMDLWSLNREAHVYYNNNYNKNNVITLVPVCKYIPTPFHPLVLNYKLAKIYKTTLKNKRMKSVWQPSNEIEGL